MQNVSQSLDATVPNITLILLPLKPSQRNQNTKRNNKSFALPRNTTSLYQGLLHYAERRITWVN